MNKFKFRFQSVTKVRKIELEQQAKVLALLMKEIADAKTAIDDLKRKDKDEIIRVQALTKKGEFVEQIVQISLSYREGLRLQVLQKRREIDQLNSKAEVERRKLQEAEKKKKILDKYEEKEREKYEQEARSVDRKEMDEIASVLRTFSSE